MSCVRNQGESLHSFADMMQCVLSCKQAHLFPVCLQWTPEGRRLVTGASSGEFTLWNGLTFNFETILQVSLCYQTEAGVEMAVMKHGCSVYDHPFLFLLDSFEVSSNKPVRTECCNFCRIKDGGNNKVNLNLELLRGLEETLLPPFKTWQI